MTIFEFMWQGQDMKMSKPSWCGNMSKDFGTLTILVSLHPNTAIPLYSWPYESWRNKLGYDSSSWMIETTKSVKNLAPVGLGNKWSRTSCRCTTVKFNVGVWYNDLLKTDRWTFIEKIAHLGVTRLRLD